MDNLHLNSSFVKSLTGILWGHPYQLGVGNGLFVAFNGKGSHTHILDTNRLPANKPVQNSGYWDWKLIETEFSPSKRKRFAMASLGNGKALLYGGLDDDGNSLSDAFIISVSFCPFCGPNKKEVYWSKTKDAPVKRAKHAMAALKAGTILMYGGYDNRTHFNDAYLFSIADDKTGKEEGEWIKTKEGPGKRDNHAMTSMGDGKILMCGGFDGGNVMNGSFIFSTNGQTGKEEGQWTTINVETPGRRAKHAMAKLEPNKILMYGGFDNYENAEKTSFIFSTSSKTGTEKYQWQQIVDGPDVRASHSMVTLSPGKILMYGGTSGDNNGLKNAFIFSTKSTTEKEEYQYLPTKDGPSKRNYHAMARLNLKNVLMYGGDVDTDKFSDAFLYQVSINDKTGEEGQQHCTV